MTKSPRNWLEHKFNPLHVLCEKNKAMSIQTISFKTPPPKSGTGMPLPEGSDLPKMRGRKALNIKKEIEQLDIALDSLSYAPCSFWACHGPSYPRHMTICNKCWAMRKIAGVRATLVRQLTQ